MSLYHAKLLNEIKEYQRSDIDQESFKHYHGTHRFCYGVRVPDKRKVAKNFLKENTLTSKELIELLNSLYKGKSFDERSLTGYLLEFSPHRMNIPLAQLEEWLGQLEGWAEVDTTCQSNFSASEVLLNWSEWKKLLVKLNQSSNINQRRASLVLLVKPTSQSADPRISELAFKLIQNLEKERDILITKAISWLLRSMTTHHSDAVAKYLVEHQETLPTLAIRETKTKLATGKKNHGRKD